MRRAGRRPNFLHRSFGLEMRHNIKRTVSTLEQALDEVMFN